MMKDPNAVSRLQLIATTKQLDDEEVYWNQALFVKAVEQFMDIALKNQMAYVKTQIENELKFEEDEDPKF